MPRYLALSMNIKPLSFRLSSKTPQLLYLSFRALAMVRCHEYSGYYFSGFIFVTSADSGALVTDYLTAKLKIHQLGSACSGQY